MCVYNKKDLIIINQEVGEKGFLQNESSLEFALDIIKNRKSWIFQLSYLMRSILVDHAFQDGNKRTTLVLSTLYFEDNEQVVNRARLMNSIAKISNKNITDINQITREIKNARTD